MPEPVLIDNRAARRIFIDRHGLSDPPNTRQDKDALLSLIERIGFVQVDSINTVERAHHMILFARNQTYRKTHLAALLEKDRRLFESWTHDASIIPMRFYPYWRRRFLREAAGLRKRWRSWRQGDFEAMLEEIAAHVRDNGPVLCREMEDARPGGVNGWWDWKPSKTALEYLWRTGVLAVCRRQGFQKVYDLAENVAPPDVFHHDHDDPALIDWACNAALDRLGFATSGEIAAYWEAVTPAEARDWCAAQSDLIEVAFDTADGSRPRTLYARPDLIAELDRTPEPPGRVRILSPFDPMIRDRKRTERLFGFSYRIEVFVPAPKRVYGYYVFPLMEGDRLIGRIDMKALRNEGVLSVTGLWLEPKVKLSAGRRTKLEAELERVARFSGCASVRYEDGWIR